MPENINGQQFEEFHAEDAITPSSGENDQPDVTRRRLLEAVPFFLAANAEAKRKRHEKTIKPQQKKHPHTTASHENPHPLAGNRHSIDIENAKAQEEGLVKIPDEKKLKELVRSETNPNGIFVPLPTNEALIIDPHVNAEGEYTEKVGKIIKHTKARRKYKRGYCLPEVKDFLEDLSEQYKKAFSQNGKFTGTPIMLTSAIRPLDEQKHITDINGTGSKKSPHPTGAVVDIAYGDVHKKYLNGKAIVRTDEFGNKILEKGKETYEVIHHALKLAEYQWLEKKLEDLSRNNNIQEGKIHVIDEHSLQKVFHIMVFKDYSTNR